MINVTVKTPVFLILVLILLTQVSIVATVEHVETNIQYKLEQLWSYQYGYAYSIRFLEWSPDGEKIAVGIHYYEGSDRLIILSLNGEKILDVEFDHILWNGDWSYDTVYIAWSPSGNKISFFAYNENEEHGFCGAYLYVYTSSGNLLWKKYIDGSSCGGSIAWSPIGDKIAVITCVDDKLVVFDANTGSELSVNKFDEDVVSLDNNIAWSPSGDKIAIVGSVGYNGLLMIFQGAGEPHLNITLDATFNSCDKIIWSPGGSIIAIAYNAIDSDRLAVYTISGDLVFEKTYNNIYDISWLKPNNYLLVIAYNEVNEVSLLTQNGELVWRTYGILLPDPWLLSSAFTPSNEKLVLSGSGKNILYVLSLVNGEIICEESDDRLSSNTATKIDLSSDGAKIVAFIESYWSGYNFLIIYSIEGTRFIEYDPSENIHAVKWHPLINDIIALAFDDRIVVYRFVSVMPPIASFTIEVSGVDVRFDASNSYDQDGFIMYYLWDFGDGFTLNTTNSIVLHTYSEPGSYNVTLTVVDNDGLYSSISMIVVISKEEYPNMTLIIPRFAAIPSLVGAIPFVINNPFNIPVNYYLEINSSSEYIDASIVHIGSLDKIGLSIDPFDPKYSSFKGGYGTINPSNRQLYALILRFRQDSYRDLVRNIQNVDQNVVLYIRYENGSIFNKEISLAVSLTNMYGLSEWSVPMEEIWYNAQEVYKHNGYVEVSIDGIDFSMRVVKISNVLLTDYNPLVYAFNFSNSEVTKYFEKNGYSKECIDTIASLRSKLTNRGKYNLLDYLAVAGRISLTLKHVHEGLCHGMALASILYYQGLINPNTPFGTINDPLNKIEVFSRLSNTTVSTTAIDLVTGLHTYGPTYLIYPPPISGGKLVEKLNNIFSRGDVALLILANPDKHLSHTMVAYGLILFSERYCGVLVYDPNGKGTDSITIIIVDKQCDRVYYNLFGLFHVVEVTPSSSLSTIISQREPIWNLLYLLLDPVEKYQVLYVNNTPIDTSNALIFDANDYSAIMLPLNEYKILLEGGQYSVLMAIPRENSVTAYNISVIGGDSIDEIAILLNGSLKIKPGTNKGVEITVSYLNTTGPARGVYSCQTFHLIIPNNTTIMIVKNLQYMKGSMEICIDLDSDGRLDEKVSISNGTSIDIGNILSQKTIGKYNLDLYLNYAVYLIIIPIVLLIVLIIRKKMLHK